MPNSLERNASHQKQFDPRRPLMLVFWRDAQLVTGWGPYDEASGLSVTMTVGFFLRYTKTTLEIAQSATAEGTFDAVFVIPRNAIKRLIRLGTKRKVTRGTKTKSKK